MFSPTGLPPEFQWLRTPYPERIFALSARPGWLRLIGRESIGSWFEQALVARRQEHFSYRAETELDFRPQNFQQAAGITAYYNQHKFHFLAVVWRETTGRALTILSCEADYPDGRLSFPLAEPVRLDADGPVRLSVAVERETLQFSFAHGEEWRKIGPRPRRFDLFRRSRTRGARLLHRRLRRHGRFRHFRRGDSRRTIDISCTRVSTERIARPAKRTVQ